jgi:hypothetical protein
MAKDNEPIAIDIRAMVNIYRLQVNKGRSIGLYRRRITNVSSSVRKRIRRISLNIEIITRSKIDVVS